MHGGAAGHGGRGGRGPAIINSGTQWGPVDGTSAVSRAIDEVFGDDRPGRVFVLPSGDEGGLPNHAGGTFAAGSDAVIGFTKVSTATTYGQIWYDGAHPAGITITASGGASVGPVLPGQFIVLASWGACG